MLLREMVNHWYLWLPFSLTSMIDKNRQIQTIDMLLSVKNKINLKKFQYKKNTLNIQDLV